MLLGMPGCVAVEAAGRAAVVLPSAAVLDEDHKLSRCSPAVAAGSFKVAEGRGGGSGTACYRATNNLTRSSIWHEIQI